ncbi:MAG: hypothetical protein ABSG57_04765 [Candidatus Bathyarchaeia archaeon]
MFNAWLKHRRKNRRMTDRFDRLALESMKLDLCETKLRLELERQREQIKKQLGERDGSKAYTI